MNCVIVDDEPKALDILEGYIRKVPFLHLLQSFRDPMDFISFYKDHIPDVVFLDVSMPGLSGIDLAKMIRERSFVIFTTAHNQYALDGFDVNAIDFLVKPISFDRFVASVSKASELKALKDFYRNKTESTGIQARGEYLFFKSGTAIYKIDANDILYLEKEGNYFKMHTVDRNFLVRLNFFQIMNQLPKDKFIRVHKSFIVHLKFIEKVEASFVFIRNQQIPISNNFRSDLLEAISGNGR